MSDVDVSIDRVSLVGKCLDPYELQMWLQRQEANEGTTQLPQITTSKDTQRSVTRRWQHGGVNCSIRVQQPKYIDRTVERWECDPEDDAAMRLEWNPNRHDASDLLAFMGESRPTRLDVALDYEDHVLEDWALHRPRCKRTSYVDVRGNLNGIQLGGMKSERFLVGYDKGLELGRPDLSLMRLEMRQRVLPGREALPGRLFEGVEAIRREIPHNVSPSMAGMLALRLYAPEHYMRLERHTRNKYDAIAQERCGRMSPEPDSIYRDKLSDLREWAAMLKDCDQASQVPTAKVYAKSGASEDAPLRGPDKDGKSL